MSAFYGRDRELKELESLCTSRALGASSVVLTGPNGIGKTAMLDAYLARVDATVVRVQTNRLSALLPPASMPALSPECIVAIDDAHWCSPAIVAHVRAAMEAGTIACAIACAPDAFTLDGRESTRIELGPLSNEAVERIAGAEIAPWANGSPYEATMLAALGERDVSAARAIARFIVASSPAARMLAQMLALIGVPIDHSFARALIPDTRELAGARESLAPLLAGGTEELAFNHVLTESAVVETIAMKIPLHRRIIAALERRGVHDLRDRIILLEQLLGSGDRARAQDAAIDLAFEAQRGLASGAQLWASERHVELGEPSDERFVAFYTQYTQALVANGDAARAETVASHAFSAAQRNRLPDAVVLGAQIIDAQWKLDRKEAARATFDRLSAAFPDASALSLLRRAAPWLGAD